MPTRRLPRAVREQQMLDAAVAVFSRRGYHAASVDEIATAAGISKPMVYAYLGSKEQLFIACLHREGLRLMEAIVTAAGHDGVGSGRAPDEQLWRGLRAFFGVVAAHRDGWAVLYGQARGQEPFAAVLTQLRARMVEIVSGMLARARGARGSAAVPPRSPPRPRGQDTTIMGYAVVGAAEALADWLVAHPDEDSDLTATRLMDVVWAGAGAAVRGETWR
jgi:AcrR family transcriptional regulator